MTSVLSALKLKLLSCALLAAVTVPVALKAGEAKKTVPIVTNSVGMKLVLVPSGEFMMGSKESAAQLASAFKKYEDFGADFTNEYPYHRVRITEPFYMGICPVTRGQFQAFVKDSGYVTAAEKDKNGGHGYTGSELTASREYSWHNVGFKQADDHPVLDVSWDDACEFCRWLSRREKRTYQLPREAQWEYACRAGTSSRYYNGDDPEMLAQVGNVADAAYRREFPYYAPSMIRASDGYVFTSPVGKFRPNSFGLYDMHGNVLQWCRDWYDPKYYAVSPRDDPPGPARGSRRVWRGSGWGASPGPCISAYRGGWPPSGSDVCIGFRVVWEPQKEDKNRGQGPK
jgi:formylglycine-generating enzyme required for sulfatase activity